MLPKEQLEAYNKFYDSAYENKILDPKTTVMIHLASAMSAGKVRAQFREVRTRAKK